METKTQIELEKAKEYFYQLKLIESYNILRRFFDRLPFKPEPQHGEYIGMFIRVLSELGKKNELSFYVTELEKLEPKIQSPMISYQLAVAYVNADPPQLRLAVSLLEKFLKTQIQGDFIAKAKMTLAYCYDSISKDTAAVRKLIFSIEQIEDKSLSYLLETWKAKVLRDEGNYVESEKTLNQLLSYLKPEMDWYSYFTAKIISIGLYRDWGKMNLARQLLVETTQLSKEKPLRTVVRQLTAIRESFVEPKSDEPMILKIGNDKEVVCYQNHEFCFDNSKAFDKLTKLFMIHKRMTKEEIIQALFSRDYSAESDDSVIYYHIHGVKKVLKKIGLNQPSFGKKGIYYEFEENVQILKEGV